MSTEPEVVAEGLQFPEGPVALPDGSVLVVEIARGTLSRVGPDGTVSVVAETGGGPNGAAIGPDGLCYVCNNGGFEWHERGGRLSPDESEPYVAETWTGRLWAFRLSGPGQLEERRGPAIHGGHLLAGRPGYHLFDSLAVQADGDVCVATIGEGGITTISPAGREPAFVALPDRMTTNICFGGPDLRTAFVTLSSVGQLVRLEWPNAGLPLNFHDQ